jgi:uncharacterized membrane protein YkvA (DUF1232 family)
MAFENLNYPLQWSKDEKRFERDIKNLNESDIDYAVREGRAKYAAMKEPPSALSDCWEDLGLMIDLLEDWKDGRFREISWQSVSRMAGAVAYFTTPIDIVPDTIPGGYRDDAFFLKRVAKKVEDELLTYRHWQRKKSM